MRLASACVAGLAENLAIDDDDGVGSKHRLAGLLAENCLGFLPRQAFRAVARDFSRQRNFRNVGGGNGKPDSRVAQQFLAAGRGGSEHEHG